MTVHARPLLASTRFRWILSLPVAIPTTTSAFAGGGFAPFTEEAAQRGVNYIIGQPGWQFGFGAAFVDLDNDRDPDIVAVGRAAGHVGVYENDGTGHFIDRTVGTGIALITNSSGVIAADYDGDGDMDLYFFNWGVSERLYRNDGGFAFTDVTAAAGLGDDGEAVGSAWGDFDGDGWLDLYKANRTIPLPGSAVNKLYRNLGDGTFVDVAPAQGVDDDEPTFQACFFDMENDGDADLYLSTDKGNVGCSFSNHLFENVGGNFVDITDPSGTAGCIVSMGVSIADFDRNGYQDIYCTNVDDGNILLMNQGDDTFVESATAYGVESFALGWAAIFFDFDNDSNLDLYVCNSSQPNRLFCHEPTPPYPDLAASLGVADIGLSYAAAAADIDDDGDLDLLVQNNNAPLRLYINNEGHLRRWAKFEVVGRQQNLHAIGAQVRVRNGDAWQMREVIAGSNYKSQNELVQHVGLGAATHMEELVVQWPGGDTRTFANVAGDRTWRIVPPERVGDIDENGGVDVSDLVDMILQWGECGLDQCSADLDLSGAIDVSDLVALILNWSP